MIIYVDTPWLLDDYAMIFYVGTAWLLNDLLYISLSRHLSHDIYTLNSLLFTVVSLSPRAAATKRKAKTMEIDFIGKISGGDNFTPFCGL
jgi:hypothetical protein